MCLLVQVDDALMSKEEMAAAAKENDKKLKNLEAELAQLQEDLSTSERQRKAVEGERDELQEEINNSSSSK